MKYFELKSAEEKLLKDFDRGHLKSVPNLKEEAMLYHRYAKGSLNRTRNINIRLSERDLQKIKARAAEIGSGASNAARAE